MCSLSSPRRAAGALAAQHHHAASLSPRVVPACRSSLVRLCASVSGPSASQLSSTSSSQPGPAPRPAASIHNNKAQQPSAVATAVATVLEAAPVPAVAATSNRVRDLSPETFTSFLQDAGDDLVIVDYYTDWCGPCKIMHGELDKLANAFKTMQFGKVNCSHAEAFSTRQRIRSLPTIRVYHRGVCLDEVKGAKPLALRQMLMHYNMMKTLTVCQ